MSFDPIAFLTALQDGLNGFLRVMPAVCVLIGIVMFFVSAKNMAKATREDRSEESKPFPIFGQFLLAALMVAYGMTRKMMTDFTDIGVRTAMVYQAVGPSPLWTLATTVMNLILIFAGSVALGRGLVRWWSALSGGQVQSPFWSGFWHVVGGAMLCRFALA